MKMILISRRRHHSARISVFLTMVALIAGTVGCSGGGVIGNDLTIETPNGGSVITPGEGTFTYEEGTVVDLAAEAEEGYQFVNWTGDVGTIADVNAASTTIAMDGDYTIAASFTRPCYNYTPNVNAFFVDQFDDLTLGVNWTEYAGRGNYTLSENPGHLRYLIDANHVSPSGTAGYYQALLLILPFSGQEWTLRTRITYNLRPGSPTNNRGLDFFVREPHDPSTSIIIGRSVGVYDDNPGSNALGLFASEPGHAAYTTLYFPNQSGPLPPDTEFFAITRSGDHFAIRVSTDCNDSTFENEFNYTFSTGTFGNDQEIVIGGSGWYGAPGGWADVDFIEIEVP